jgi:hypothetical protein
MKNDETQIDYESLKQRLFAQLSEQGFAIDGERLSLRSEQKATLRATHAKACAHQIERAKGGLARFEHRLLASIADGREIDPTRITPHIVEVTSNSWEELLFRYARLHWSIPVSAGYGRRLRFLIWDNGHDKLMGILGLSDPVFALGARDTWVGWDREQRRTRLANVMDAFVLGAVPPYSGLLGGKLVALAATSNEIRDAFDRRYANKMTLINGRRVGPLALITTTSALGRSSIYNRLVMDGRTLFQSVGFTSGSGDFPFMNGVYRDLRQLALEASSPTAKHAQWGTGFRNRREVVLKALGLLGLPRNLIYHGISREVFVVPLATNTQSFLRGEADTLDAVNLPFAKLADRWKERWALPRAIRDTTFREFQRGSWRLWGKL